MIEQSIVHLPDLIKDIDRPVSIYLMHLSRCLMPPGVQDVSADLVAWGGSWRLLSGRRGDLVLRVRRHGRAWGHGSGWSFLTTIRRYAAAARPRTWPASRRS